MTHQRQPFTLRDRLPPYLADSNFWFLLLAALLFIAALIYTLHTWAWVKDAQHTTGRVVELVPGRETSTPSARVQYIVNDQPYQYHQTFTDFGNYQVGQQLPIIYDPTNPGRAKLQTFPEIWLGPILLFASSLILALFELPFLYYHVVHPGRKPLAGYQSPGIKP
jgi:hypothetical protein